MHIWVGFISPLFVELAAVVDALVKENEKRKATKKTKAQDRQTMQKNMEELLLNVCVISSYGGAAYF